MLLREITDMFISDTNMCDEFNLIAKVGLCYALCERLLGLGSISKDKVDAYVRYNRWEYERCGFVNSDVPTRVLGSEAQGKIAFAIQCRGEYYLNSIFNDICSECCVENIYGESGFIDFIRGWLDSNEDEWLSCVS